MRQRYLQYRCEVKESNMLLILKGWYVALYPLSFTVEECLEEFCDSVGWEFLDFDMYELHCNVLNDTRPMSVIIRCADRLCRELNT